MKLSPAAWLVGLAGASIIIRPPLSDLPQKPPAAPSLALGTASNGNNHNNNNNIFSAALGPRRTIYDVIKTNPHMRRFAALLDAQPTLRARLDRQDGEARFTVFVPVDDAAAWDHVWLGDDDGEGEDEEDEDEEDEDEYARRLLQYHVVEGAYTVGHVLRHRTLETLLRERALGEKPQRLRVSAGIFGAHLNSYSKMIATDSHASNGILHALSSPLVLPPTQLEFISRTPSKFSTLVLALEQTGLAMATPGEGGTLFAPTDIAWTKLGDEATAFLFSPRGTPYLRALLRYHMVANQTLYSDRHYRPQEDDEDRDVLAMRPVELEASDDDDDVVSWLRLDGKQPAKTESETRYHVRLPTLSGAEVFVEISSWRSVTNMLVNGRTDVTDKDGVAADGAVHAIGGVLIPPRQGERRDGEGIGQITEEELTERLEPYVDANEKMWDEL